MSDRVSDNHGGEGSKRGRGQPRKKPPSEKTAEKQKKKICPHGYEEQRKCKTCCIEYRKHCTESGTPVNESLFDFCRHLRQKSRCVECRGTGICSHGGLRYMCKVCGGSSICSHGRQKSKCKPCKGSAICCHDKEKNKCQVCDGRALCSHGKPKTRCVPCKGGSICQHQRIRSLCRDCGGKGLCVHGKIRRRCVECVDRSKLCPCGNVSSQCKECKKMRRTAKEVSARPEVSTSGEQAQATLVDDGRPNPTIYCFQCTQHLEVDNFPPGPAYLDLTICKSCELESHQDEMNP